jgi:hypothetical protein
MKKKIFDEIKLNPDLLKDFIFRNNIKGEILKITHLPFKKILILIKYKEDISILKICYDSYSIKLSNNENKSYKIIKKKNLNFINILPFRKIRSKKNLSLTVIKFINGKKANFFEFNNFYKFTNLNKTKNFSINNYIFKKINHYIHLNKKISKDLSISKYKKKILNIYKLDKVITNYSHGDFAKYNTIKNKKNNYVIDLEFFNENRNFLYDFLFWHLVPVLNYLYKLNNILPVSIIFYLIENFIKYNLLKEKKLNINNLKLYFSLFFFERILQLKTELKLKNINQFLTKFHQKRNLKLINFYEKLLNCCLNKT